MGGPMGVGPGEAVQGREVGAPEEEEEGVQEEEGAEGNEEKEPQS